MLKQNYKGIYLQKLLKRSALSKWENKVMTSLLCMLSSAWGRQSVIKWPRIGLAPTPHPPTPGALLSNGLMGMCRWTESHFCDWIDYKGVAFSIQLLGPKSNQHQFSPKGYENCFYLFTGGYGLQTGEFVCICRGLTRWPILPKVLSYRTSSNHFTLWGRTLLHNEEICPFY